MPTKPTTLQRAQQERAKANADLAHRATLMIDAILHAQDMKHPEAEKHARQLLGAAFQEEGLSKLEEVYRAVRLLQKYGL